MRTKVINLVLLALTLAGCVREETVPAMKGGIVLNLVLEDPKTKATRDGDATLNENVISDNIDIFFYDESTLQVKKEALGARRSGNLVQIQTNPNDLEALFGTLGAGAHCGVFVVANFSGTYQGTAGSRTITQIKSSLIPAPTWETLPQASFVMTGEQQVTLGNAQGSTPVYANIGMERVAAKVTFEVTVAEGAAGEGGNWTPDTANMAVYMVYAMRKATLGAQPEDMPANKDVTYAIGNTNELVVYNQYVDKILYDTGTTKQRTRPLGDGTTTVNAPVFSTTHDGPKPFYTYPEAWETGSSMEPYMKLIIPWTYNNTTKKYYYKIPFHGNSLERNHWYHISIDVQILGTEQADPPEVTVSYAIANWSGSMDNASAENITSVTSLPATVITTRYLDVPTTEYVLFDQDNLVIPIRSSHDVEVVGFNVDETNAYKPAHIDNDANYLGSDNTRIYNPYLNTLNTSAVNGVRPNYQNDPPTPVVSASGWTITVNERESITVNHTLNRTMSSNDFDVAPYTMRFRVRHQSESDNYFTDVIIEQRPAIIIQPQRNSDDGTPNSKGHTTEDGYVFINGVRTTNDQSSNRTNTNFNMYIFETSVLPADENSALKDYVLGDPRTKTSVNATSGLSNTDFQTGVDIAGGSNRRMANYYPAEEDEDHNVFIAPSFRIASSFGTSSYMNRNTAVQRCATYQEDGYPAGRWRLPTRAEIEYMVTLSQKGKIPALFSTESDVKYGGYWCSAGAVFPLDDGSLKYKTLSEASSMTVYRSGYNNQTLGTGVHWARCVYDEWYWSDTAHEKAADKTVWTWGDEARNTVVKQ